MPLLAVVTSSTAVATDVNDVLRSSAVLAVIVGLVQTLVLFALMETGVGLGAYGLAVDNVAYGPARAYLAVRVFGNLVGVVFFAFLGVFRGLQDTVSPLAATLLFTVSSVCLEYVFLFRLSLGPAGAAAAVVAAQCLGVALQVGLLARKHRVHFGTVLGTNRRDGDGERPMDRQLVEKLAMCGILMLRTALVMLVYSSATSLVARSGSPVLSAAHQVGIECIDRFNDRSMDRLLSPTTRRLTTLTPTRSSLVKKDRVPALARQLAPSGQPRGRRTDADGKVDESTVRAVLRAVPRAVLRAVLRAVVETARAGNRMAMSAVRGAVGLCIDGRDVRLPTQDPVRLHDQPRGPGGAVDNHRLRRVLPGDFERCVRSGRHGVRVRSDRLPIRGVDDALLGRRGHIDHVDRGKRDRSASARGGLGRSRGFDDRAGRDDALLLPPCATHQHELTARRING